MVAVMYGNERVEPMLTITPNGGLARGNNDVFVSLRSCMAVLCQISRPPPWL